MNEIWGMNEIWAVSLAVVVRTARLPGARETNANREHILAPAPSEQLPL